MKRAAGAFMLLASLGGGCMSTNQVKTTDFGKATVVTKPTAYQGPYGEPIAAGNNPRAGMSPGLVRAGYVAGDAPKPGTNLVEAGWAGTSTSGGIVQVNHEPKEPPPPNVPRMYWGQGVTPVPAGFPAGAVAAVGALPAYGPRMPSNMRTEVRFGDPVGMKVTWFGPNGFSDIPLETPARYNFLQGGVYRLKLSSVANHVEKVYYPTIDIRPAGSKSITYLAHTAVPVTFTDEDFEQVDSGNFLVKVVYLPDPQFQDLATVVGPNELVSTRLEPGVDPIVEAQKRGTVLLVVRMGNIDLQAPNTPAMDAPNPYMMQQMQPKLMAPPTAPGAGPKKDGKIILPNPNPANPKSDDAGKPSTLPSFQQ